MRVRRRHLTWVVGILLACWAVLLGTGIALAEDWTPPPGAPPGCQPPPGECFPPPEGPSTKPAETLPPAQPSPAPTSEAPASSATQAPAATSSSSPKQPSEPKQSQQAEDSQTSGQESSIAGTNQDQGEGGDSPTLQIAQASLRVGEPTPVPISVLGLNPNENPQVDAVVTITGGIGEAAGTRGATLTFRTLASDLGLLLAGLVVVPDSEVVTISIRAYPVGKPEGAISASRTLAATAPLPTSATSPAPGVSQSAEEPASGELDPSPSESPSMRSRSITLPAYNPLAEPEETVGTTVAAVALIGATALAAGSMATGLTGGQPSPGGGPETRSSGPAGRREDQATAMLAPGDSGSFLAIDTNLQGLAAAAGAASLRRRRTWLLPLTAQVDRLIAAAFAATARVSPLGARMIGDSTYLRAMFGSASLLLPLAGLVLGILAVFDVQGLALAPAVALLGSVIFLGTLDALAGFIAVAVFIIGIAASGGIWDASSVRTMLGLAIVGFGPALIAGASRPMRRDGRDYSPWERIADFVVIPLVGAFAVQGTIKALPALSGYDLPIAEQANLLAVIALVGLLMRVSLEEFAARAYPERIAAVAPPDIAPYGIVRRLVLILIRTCLFGFAAVAFIGNVWQLWVGLAVFAAAELCLLLAPRMPNSPALFHAVPVGVPRFVLIVIAAIGLGTLASLLIGESADVARYSFVLLLLPGLALAALGMFGKEPREGDVRWYLRPSLRSVYRVGGVIMIVVAVWLTQFASVS